MSEPIPPPPPGPPTDPSAEPAKPFTGEPRPMPRGCARPALIGCGVLAVLLGIAAIVFVAKAKDLLAWTMGELEEQVVSAMPDDVTDAERMRLERGFDAALARIRDGELEPPALRALQKQLTNAAEKSQSGELTRDDVLDLLSALERVGGLLPATGEGSPDGEAARDPEPRPEGPIAEPSP